MSTPHPQGRLCGTREAARIMNVTPQWIRQLIALGQLPAVRVGKSWKCRVWDVVEFQRRPAHRPKGSKDKRPKAERKEVCPS